MIWVVDGVGLSIYYELDLIKRNCLFCDQNYVCEPRDFGG
jgi:hypothetical protein